jgi:anti-sigma factor RsiW
MNRHITRWLAAYHDDELNGEMRKRVEEHLGECPTCQSDLESLRRLSSLLQTVPALAETPQRSSARVRLRMAVSSTSPGRSSHRQQALRLGWQAAPLILIGGWVFTQAFLALAGLGGMAGMAVVPYTSPLQAARLGYALSGLPALENVGALLATSPWLAQAGLLLLWAVVSLGVTVFAGILLWGWIAGWWSHQQSRLPR